jgi:hypothetical protein
VNRPSKGSVDQTIAPRANFSVREGEGVRDQAFPRACLRLRAVASVHDYIDDDAGPPPVGVSAEHSRAAAVLTA